MQTPQYALLISIINISKTIEMSELKFLTLCLCILTSVLNTQISQNAVQSCTIMYNPVQSCTCSM